MSERKYMQQSLSKADVENAVERLRANLDRTWTIDGVEYTGVYDFAHGHYYPHYWPTCDFNEHPKVEALWKQVEAWNNGTLSALPLGGEFDP